MSTFRLRLPLAHFALITAFPLATGTPLNIAHAQQVLSLKDSVPSITTNGVASTEVVPDIATISLGVDTERPNAADAARDNARAAQAIVGEIKAQGIEARDIKTLSVTLSSLGGYWKSPPKYPTQSLLECHRKRSAPSSTKPPPFRSSLA